jgi:hypothetical protein
MILQKSPSWPGFVPEMTMRGCGENSAPNIKKPPALTGGCGLGAIRELGVLYTATVTVVK